MERYSVEESRNAWNANAEFWDEQMGDASNEFHRTVVRPGVSRLLNVQPGDFVLDVACGNGNYSAYMAERGARVVAETEKYRSSRPSNSAWNTVLFPTPEGPETINVFPIVCMCHSSSVMSATVMPRRGASRSAASADSTTWSLSMISTEAVLRP